MPLLLLLIPGIILGGLLSSLRRKYAVPILALVALSPMAAWGVMLWASGLDCRIDESGTYPCIVDGEDIGESLYGWHMFGAWGF